MGRLAFLVLLPLAAPALAAPAPFAKAERRGYLHRIQGEWQLVSHQRCWLRYAGADKKRLIWDAYSCGSQTVRVSGDRLVWCFRGAAVCTDVVRMGEGTLGGIDLTDHEKSRTRRGIYRLAGDELTLRVSMIGKRDRPAAFDFDREGDATYVLRRKRGD